MFLLEIEKEERKSFPRKNGSFVVTLIYQRLQPFCPVVFGSFDYVFVGSNYTDFTSNRLCINLSAKISKRNNPVLKHSYPRKEVTNMKPQYHWYHSSTIPLPNYDLRINDFYYAYLDTPEQPWSSLTGKIKYLGLFPEMQLRTYINRGYIKDYHVEPITRVERRDV